MCVRVSGHMNCRLFFQLLNLLVAQAITNLKIMDEKEGLISTSTPPPEVANTNIISCSTCGTQQTKEFRLGKCACRTKRYFA